ncbi:NADP-dependent 3-hydroxy acid dehydrogenase YdfG [Frondihabitans sp. PhB188]|uniref:SDR family oxidoreductase n=1 Tax=Frondihabitans sp. PhB188 TaxID=2485200 RepID=UPI000F4A4ED8|nr:SDR family oxidoreductase [Frondihabitans sp. PhB188]ROQ41625.1 NADP-dependent 3-hydroxy acid dehydrogenase YdfG [Frondihabitans sp. PhB188]
MDLQISDRVYLVLGGAGYIGSAIVDRLRAEGAIAISASRHAVDGIAIDGADPASVKAGVDAAVAQHGHLDGLIVTAAPSASTLDAERLSDPEQVLSAFDGKAMTFLRTANEVIPHLRQRGFGRIIGVSGQNAYFTGNITASIRNAGLNIVAKNLADELAGSGITVNTVNPGVVADEPRAEVSRAGAGQSSPQQIADLIAFLASPLSSTSGEQIAVGHRVLGIASA